MICMAISQDSLNSYTNWNVSYVEKIIFLHTEFSLPQKAANF